MVTTTTAAAARFSLKTSAALLVSLQAEEVSLSFSPEEDDRDSANKRIALVEIRGFISVIREVPLL